MLARAVVLVAMLAACEREQARETKRPPEPCFADDIGELRTEWSYPDECDEDLAACRTLCGNGDGDACFFVATKNTSDTQDDDAKPFKYYERACKLGVSIGCTNWAAAHWAGNAPKPHPSLGCLYRVFETSCAVDEPFGCSMTARIHLESPKTLADVWIGFNKLTNACNNFEGPPCRFLAYYIERGDFGPSDPTRVKHLLERACKGGDDDACGKESAADSLHD